MKIKNISVILIILEFLGLSANVQGASKYIKSEELKNNWPFPTEKYGSIYCKNIGNGRKAVWLNASATYALNGQAMTWMIGNDLIGADGGSVKIGRDHSNNPGGLSKLISIGLALCK